MKLLPLMVAVPCWGSPKMFAVRASPSASVTKFVQAMEIGVFGGVLNSVDPESVGG